MHIRHALVTSAQVIAAEALLRERKRQYLSMGAGELQCLDPVDADSHQAPAIALEDGGTERAARAFEHIAAGEVDDVAHALGLGEARALLRGLFAQPRWERGFVAHCVTH